MKNSLVALSTILGASCLPLYCGCGSSNTGYEKTVQSLDGSTVIRIDLSNTKVTDEDLAAMKFPESLQVISLNNTAITDDGVEELLRAKNLEEVNLGNTEITSASMQILEQLPKLQMVNVAGKNISTREAIEFYNKIAEESGVEGPGKKAAIKMFPANELQPAP